MNTVVIAGANDDEILDFVALAKSRPLEIRFIEFMPFLGNGWREERFVPSTAIVAAIEASHPLVPDLGSDRTGGPAKHFVLPGFRGRVSLVTPFTDSFCQRCNRLRLTADGHLKTCLYAAPEVDLGEALRRGDPPEAIAGLIRSAVAKKPRSHPPLAELAGKTRTMMNMVGG